MCTGRLYSAGGWGGPGGHRLRRTSPEGLVRPLAVVLAGEALGVAPGLPPVEDGPPAERGPAPDRPGAAAEAPSVAAARDGAGLPAEWAALAVALAEVSGVPEAASAVVSEAAGAEASAGVAPGGAEVCFCSPKITGVHRDGVHPFFT